MGQPGRHISNAKVQCGKVLKMPNTNGSEGRIKDKVALVTGAGSGIGQACALRFADEGAMVVAIDQESPSFESQYSQTILEMSGDVTKTDDARDMVAQTIHAFGKLDIVVNSAGVSGRNALEGDADPENIWDRVIEVNLKGTYLVSWYAVTEMKKEQTGSIVNLASIMGLVGYPKGLGGGFNAYAPSKGGVIQFTKTLAVDLAGDGIRVNCLCPGYVNTNLTASLTKDPTIGKKLLDLHPMERLGTAAEIANAALFLASDEASFITGSSLVIDGGYTAQ